MIDKSLALLSVEIESYHCVGLHNGVYRVADDVMMTSETQYWNILEKKLTIPDNQ